MLWLVLRSVTAAIFTLATLLVEEREVVWVLAFLAALGVTIIATCKAFLMLLTQHQVGSALFRLRILHGQLARGPRARSTTCLLFL